MLGVQSPVRRAPTGVRETTLFELVYSALPAFSFVDGVNAYVGGILHTNGQSGVSSSAIVPGQGLVWNSAVGLTETFTGIAAGEPLRIIGKARALRGRWSLWSYISTATSPGVNSGFRYDLPHFQCNFPDYWIHQSVARGLSSPNLSLEGGFSLPGGGGNTLVDGWYPPVYTAIGAAANVLAMVFRSPWEVEHYYGAWSATTGWPLLSAMTHAGNSRMTGDERFVTRNPPGSGDSITEIANFQNANFSFGGKAQSGLTGTFTVDRWRILGHDDW